MFFLQRDYFCRILLEELHRTLSLTVRIQQLVDICLKCSRLIVMDKINVTTYPDQSVEGNASNSYVIAITGSPLCLFYLLSFPHSFPVIFSSIPSLVHGNVGMSSPEKSCPSLVTIRKFYLLESLSYTNSSLC